MSEEKSLETGSEALNEMNFKQLLINILLNLEKTRGEARAALRQIKDKSHEVNDLILAIDGMRGKYEHRISSLEQRAATLEESSKTLIKAIIELNTPWYTKLWNRVNGSRKTSSKSEKSAS